jgi:hypothetical protein
MFRLIETTERKTRYYYHVKTLYFLFIPLFVTKKIA